ncbi:uncharacterized protein [Aegilops tauschii subsp. strangulata]|uniref:uncharacterized protein isoform X3 n=1 Tax=Aegilops tauschii subsp. strangulata TaxID=200361 RepID=UPI003CC8C10A
MVSHLMWRNAGGIAWSSAKRAGKLLWSQLPPTISRKQLHRNCADMQVKKIWFESSSGPQSGQSPSPGPLRFRTSTPDGRRPRIHCHKKILILRGRRISQMEESASWPGEGAMARYRDLFVEGVTPTAYAFAIVEQRGGKGTISLRTSVAGEIKNLNVAKPVKSSRLERITSILSTSGSFLSILKICSLSTILREYSAMHSVASLPFKDLILSASEKNKDGDDQNRAWNVPEPLREYLKTNLNDSQLDAVNAFRADPLSLFRALQEPEKHKLSLDFSVLFSIPLQQECRPKEGSMFKSMGLSWTLRASLQTG